MSKKIYIKIDKPIEPGDLVRCVEYDDECEPGDVRKVSRMNEHYKTIFYAHGSGRPLSKDFWEPVRKLKVGDRVICNRPRLEKNPWSVNYIESQGSYPVLLMQINPVHYLHANAYELELYQPEKHDPKPVRKEAKMNENRRAEMKQEVAEMIVELLDRAYKEIYPQSSVLISNWRDLDNTVTAKDNGDQSHEAKLHPNDTWDTLTGVFVALSKATGRKLPDWIYGEEK